MKGRRIQMKIALLGKGKMAGAIRRIAEQEGHSIVATLDSASNPPANKTFQGSWVQEADVIIDFSAPGAAVDNVLRAVHSEIPIVEGTTGWQDRVDWLSKQVVEAGGSCVYASNFSLGMQLFFKIVADSAAILSRFPAYAPYLEERHHRFKQDAPSGTALYLLRLLGKELQTDVPAGVLRAGSFPGTHEVGFDSIEDTIVLRHTARNRDGFARGALHAARLIQGKSGFFEFGEILFS